MARRLLSALLLRLERKGARLVTATIVVLYGATWKPPANPSPQVILSEAETDTTAGHYENALAKHVWFYENALKYNAGLAAIRLSFALHSWKALADVYPPALAALKARRNSAGVDAAQGARQRDSFRDFAALNRTLEEDERTTALFIELDRTRPALAREVFDVAEPALVKAKAYGLCGKYLDPDRSFQRTLELYRDQLRIAPGFPDVADEVKRLAEAQFTSNTAILVALLVRNSRPEDANRVVAEAKRAWSNDRFWSQLERAQKGEFPPPD